MKSLSRVQLFATPWTVAYQAPLSMGFSRHEYWSGVPFPSPGDLPDPGIEPRSATLQADTLPSEPPGKFRIHNKAPYCHQVECLPISFSDLSTLTLKMIFRSWGAMLEGLSDHLWHCLLYKEETGAKSGANPCLRSCTSEVAVMGLVLRSLRLPNG